RAQRACEPGSPTRGFCALGGKERSGALGPPRATSRGAGPPTRLTRWGLGVGQCPTLGPLCGSKRELCTRFLNEAHNGRGAPRARPPERSGATGPPTRVFQRVGVKAGPRERRRGGSAGAKPPGSSSNRADTIPEEVGNLARESCLVEGGAVQVFLAEARHIPAALREIG